MEVPSIAVSGEQTVDLKLSEVEQIETRLEQFSERMKLLMQEVVEVQAELAKAREVAARPTPSGTGGCFW